MSYILDALKKADAERERGTVPGLHSQPLGQVDDDGEATRRPVAPAMWLVAGAGICLIAVLSWQLLSRPSAPMVEPNATPTAEAPPMNGTPAEPMQAPAAVEQRMPAPPFAAAPPPTPADQPPAMAQASPRPNAAEVTAMTPPPRPAAPPAAPPATPPATMVREAPGRATAAAPPTPPAPAAARIPAMSELPDDIKRELPQLMIGGAMYSDTPASRMLIINSQVFHEGDQPYQGLVLEEIRLKSAVFKYRGYRYAINY